MLEYLQKEYPEEWSEFLAPGGQGSYDTRKTGLEGSWLYDWDPWPNRRSSPRKKLKGGGKKTFKKRQMGGHRRHCVKVTGSCDYHLKCKDDKSKKWEYMKYKEKYKPDHCKKTKKKKSKRR